LPLYEYACPKCGTFERVQKFSDPILKKCPTCGKPVEKLLSAPAIQFKGTGWYVTDYAGKTAGREKGEKAERGEKADKGDKGDKGDRKDAGSGSDKASKDSGGARESSSAAAKSSEKKSSDKS